MIAILYALITLTILISPATSTVPEIAKANASNFIESLNPDGFTLVEFFSPDCSYCVPYAGTVKQFADHLNQMNNYNLPLSVQQFNCKGKPYCSRLAVYGIPAIRLYKGKLMIASIEGAQSIDKLISWFEGEIQKYRPAIPMETEINTNNNVTDALINQ